MVEVVFGIMRQSHPGVNCACNPAPMPPDIRGSNAVLNEKQGAPGMRLIIAVLLIGLGLASTALAAPCATDDWETRVSGVSQCLLMRRYGPENPSVMVVWLHGNVSTGGPANSHFLVARKTAADLASDRLLAVALVRPGYPDGEGAFSSGSDNGRTDNWQRQTIAEISAAIDRLRQRFKPQTVVLVGHSGGAAIAAVIMGLHPQLAQAAVLIACPCDLTAWRAGRRGPQWASEDPMRWTATVNPSARILALTGSLDDTTAPELAQAYIARLQARGIAASFEWVAGAGHIDIIRASTPVDAVARVLHQP